MLIAFAISPPTARADVSTFADGSFETPALSNNSFVIRPTGTPWTYTTNAGVIRNSTAWQTSGVPAVDGFQVGFLQTQGFFGNGQVGTMKQTITFSAAGSYHLNYFLAGRLGPTGEGGDLPFDIFLGAVKIGSDASKTGMAFQARTINFDVKAGTYDLLFQGHAPVPNTNGFEDGTAFFDAMAIVVAPEPSSIALTGAIISLAGAGYRVRKGRRQRVLPAEVDA